MNQTLPLKKVREDLSELVGRVAYGDQKIVITRFGKPVAALVTIDDYEKIMDPRKRFSADEWEKGFKVIDKMRANAKNYSPKKIEKVIEQTVNEVRQSKRV